MRSCGKRVAPVGEGTLECPRLLNFEIARLYIENSSSPHSPFPSSEPVALYLSTAAIGTHHGLSSERGGAGHQPAPRRDQPQAHQVRPPSHREILCLCVDWKHTHRLRGDRRPTEYVRVSNKRSLHASVVFACRCTARKHYTCIIATNGQCHSAAHNVVMRPACHGPPAAGNSVNRDARNTTTTLRAIYNIQEDRWE